MSCRVKYSVEFRSTSPVASSSKASCAANARSVVRMRSVREKSAKIGDRLTPIRRRTSLDVARYSFCTRSEKTAAGTMGSSSHGIAKTQKMPADTTRKRLSRYPKSMSGS